MQKRRIQLSGRSTLTVSLPNKWIKEIGLNKGDFVTVVPERDGSLRIVQDSMIFEKGVMKTCTIHSDLCHGDKLLEKVIIASYIKGCDSIKIISSSRISKENLKAIRDAELKMMGLGIVEETPSRTILQCSINPAHFQIDQIIRRLYALFSTMYDEAIQALVIPNIELAEEAQRREREANMIYDLILRLLNQAQLNSEISKEIGIHKVEDITNMSFIASALERMADWAYFIAKDVVKIETTGILFSDEIKSNILDYHKKIKDVCDKAMKSEFTFDVELANRAINYFRESLEAECCNIIDGILYKNIYHGFGELRQIVCAHRRIGEIAGHIAESAIDRAIEKNNICGIC